jgi:hypothetical protein
LQDSNGTAIKLQGFGAEYPREAIIVLNPDGLGVPGAGYILMTHIVPGCKTCIWSTD